MGYMHIPTRKKILYLILAVSLLLPGCSSPTPEPQPTQDPVVYFTQSAATVYAEFTQEALDHPSATPPPTSTPLPSATPTVTKTPIPPTPEDTSTPTATDAPAFSGEFLYASPFPEYRFKYVPNEKFNIAIGFENTGTATWEMGGMLVLSGYVGEIHVQTEAVLGKNVAPGEKVEFDLWAYAAELLGWHTYYFQLYDRSGVAIEGASAVFSYESY